MLHMCRETYSKRMRHVCTHQHLAARVGRASGSARMITRMKKDNLRLLLALHSARESKSRLLDSLRNPYAQAPQHSPQKLWNL